MSKKPYDVVVFEEFEQNGEKRTKGYTVGVAFENPNGGFNVTPAPGVALCGRFSILPRKDKKGDDAAN